MYFQLNVQKIMYISYYDITQFEFFMMIYSIYLSVCIRIQYLFNKVLEFAHILKHVMP